MTDSNSGKARQVRLLTLDVDGVLTDGGLFIGPNGEEHKRFNSLDGQGLRMALDNGIEIAVITGRSSKAVELRMRDLGIHRIYQGTRHKLAAWKDLLENCAIEPLQAAYVGDDLPDLPLMRRAGFAIAVQNAHRLVKQHCDWVTSQSGGHGAVREVTDFILDSQGLLDASQQAWLE